jgi:parvulin-like peptidyl-prolyl isomerase
MTLRVKPNTRRRRTHWQNEERTQFLVTIGFIVVVVLALLALLGAVGSDYYNRHLKSVAKVGSSEIAVDQLADRAKLISYRISRARARLREAAGAGEIDASQESAKSSELDTKDQSAADDALEELIDQAFQATLASARGLPGVTSAEVDAAQQKEGSLPERRHVLAIFIEAKPATAGDTPTTAEQEKARADAEKALADLNAGKPFGEVARQYSTDASKDRDGDYGTMSPANATDDAWVKAVFDLPAAGTTDVIKGSDDIYRIGRVTEITPGGEDPNFLPDLKQRISLDAYRRNLERELLSQKLVASVVGDALTGAKDQVRISEIFVADTGPAAATDPATPTAAPDEGQVKVRHILYSPKGDPSTAADVPETDPAWAEAQAKAQAAVDKLKAVTDLAQREKDFEALAKAESNDTGSGAQGGQLAFTARASFVKEFSDAIFDGQHTAGEIIGPVKSQFGYHVIFWQARRGPAVDRIKQIDDLLKAPTADFSQIAKDQSEGATADSGGDLGWQTKEQLPAEAADAILALQPGGVTAKITMSDGAHWYKVVERSQRALDADQRATLLAVDPTSGQPQTFEDWYTPQKDKAETDGIIVREGQVTPVDDTAAP